MPPGKKSPIYGRIARGHTSCFFRYEKLLYGPISHWSILNTILTSHNEIAFKTIAAMMTTHTILIINHDHNIIIYFCCFEYILFFLQWLTADAYDFLDCFNQTSNRKKKKKKKKKGTVTYLPFSFLLYLVVLTSTWDDINSINIGNNMGLFYMIRMNAQIIYYFLTEWIQIGTIFLDWGFGFDQNHRGSCSQATPIHPN